MKKYDDMVAATQDLTKRGFTENFVLQHHCIYCDRKSLSLNPSEFSVVETHRFEAQDSSPDGNSVIYAVESLNSSVKGIIVDAYGMYAEKMTAEMADKFASSK